MSDHDQCAVHYFPGRQRIDTRIDGENWVRDQRAIRGFHMPACGIDWWVQPDGQVSRERGEAVIVELCSRLEGHPRPCGPELARLHWEATPGNLSTDAPLLL